MDKNSTGSSFYHSSVVFTVKNLKYISDIWHQMENAVLISIYIICSSLLCWVFFMDGHYELWDGIFSFLFIKDGLSVFYYKGAVNTAL